MKRFLTKENRAELPPGSFRAGLYAVLSFIVLAAVIIALGRWYYRNYATHYRAEAGRDLLAITELKVNELVRYRKERLADGNILCKNPAFSKLVRRFFDQPQNEDAQRQLNAWLGNIKNHYDYSGVFLLDTQAVARLTIADAEDPMADWSAHLAAAFDSGQAVLLGFHRHGPDHPVFSGVVLPVVDETDKARPLGAVIFQIDPQMYLYPLLKRWPVPSETAETLLVRAEGNQVVFLSELRFHTNAVLNLRFSQVNTDLPAAKAVLGQEGIIEGVDYRGVPVLAALKAVPDSPWFMVARQDIAEIYAPLHAWLKQTVIMTLILLFGAAAGIGLVWRHQRVRFYRQQAEVAENLRESEKRFRHVVLGAPFPVLLHAEGGEIIQVSNSWCELTGYTHQELSSIEEWTARAYGDRQKDVELNIDALYELNGPKYEGDYNIYTKNGNELIWEFSSAPVGALSDGRRLVVSMAMDVTDRRRDEETLRETNEYLENLISYANAPIIVWNSNGKITRFNHAFEAIAGRNMEEVLGRGLEPLFSDEQREWAMAIVKRASEGERFDRVEVPIHHTNGSIRTVLWNSAPIVGPDGKMQVATIAQGTDITEHKQTMQKLSEAVKGLKISNRDLEQFAYVASHDLQEPLRMVSNYVQLIEKRYKGQLDDDADDFIAYAVDGVRRMSDLINGLLEYSRVQTVTRPSGTVHCDELLENVLHDMSRTITLAGAAVSVEPLFVITGDRIQIGRVFQNLIGNAIKFSRPDVPAEVYVRGFDEEQFWHFQVQDNGIGIEPDYVEKIFELFKRLNSRQKYSGTGIGLTVCRRIIDRHGGKIWVEPGEAGGSVFHFTIRKGDPHET